MATTTMVHVRVDETIKAQAAATLADMGLSVSDAVRMLLVRVATERALPFDVRAPNAETAAAIRELEDGRGARLESIDDLLADLNAEDRAVFGVRAGLPAGQGDAAAPPRPGRPAAGLTRGVAPRKVRRALRGTEPCASKNGCRSPFTGPKRASNRCESG